jgi:hypothetical protein
MAETLKTIKQKYDKSL